ncbi:hypothetical protein [Jannaschia sp. W003]|uniref:hypothetical protein n=1 Tax=Jannaschia sp. W003 TaxID=2867012 RepID=UPI0021A79513|nr:hypothetical protein [Jannaschia sp. W003]UWQ21645.1 hypothetical protein K3554_01040 [Jannaschia sp. W003]
MTAPRREPPLHRTGPRPAAPRPPPTRRRGWVRTLLRTLPTLLTLAALLAALATNPFAAPWAEREGRALALALEGAVRRTASEAWIAGALGEAVAAGDAERAAMLLELAADLGRPVDAAARAGAEALIAREAGALATATSCAACMADAARCRSAAEIAACAVPFELSPLGDLNALRRAGVTWAEGAEVDRLDVALALVGLGATGALLASGGGSAAVKAGAGLLRLARRMGTLTPALTRQLDLPVAWGRLPAFAAGRATLDEVTDAARLAALGTLAADMSRVRRATSTADALRLAALVDGPEDAARLARVAEAMGPRTARTAAVLGKGRLFRVTVRLTRAAAGTLALLWLAGVQLLCAAAAWLGGRVLRAAL